MPLEKARNSLSRLADAAHAGADVTLTKHGRPWARLVPAKPSGVERRRPARWALAGLDLDPDLLLPQQHRTALAMQLARQRANQRLNAGHGAHLHADGLPPQSAGILLDSHVLQWWWCTPGLLSARIQALLRDPGIAIWVSAISWLECAAAARQHHNNSWLLVLARLQLDLEDDGLRFLPIQPQHLQRACRGPLAGLDLNNAVLLAQAELEQLTLVSCDPSLRLGDRMPLW